MGIIPDNEQNGDVPAVNEFNHSYYQGILLEIGNNRGFDTFVPDQDKNKRFANTTLKEVRSLDAIPPFSYSDFVYRSSTIDVIWFNERKMPCHFFEVEHSTDIQNSLLKFFDLQDFYSKMFIVADIKRKEEYKRKITGLNSWIMKPFTRFTIKRWRRRIFPCKYDQILTYTGILIII